MQVCTSSMKRARSCRRSISSRPIVDDPFVYGQIAAANSLSDVYAMGGRPLTALAIAGFPKDADRALLSQIFAGGLDILTKAGVALLGGHTVQDQEIKFGYAVTGEIDPRRILANAGARPGDRLLLTKAIGTGIIATALKFGRAPEHAVAAAIQSMTTLNKAAGELIAALPAGVVHACTDITGFGLHGARLRDGGRERLLARDRRGRAFRCWTAPASWSGQRSRRRPDQPAALRRAHRDRASVDAGRG